MKRLTVWTFFAALIAAGAALADEPELSQPPPPATAPARSEPGLDVVMKANPACRTFTNDCEICTRAEADPQCSTPGIACQPKAWRCSHR